MGQLKVFPAPARVLADVASSLFNGVVPRSKGMIRFYGDQDFVKKMSTSMDAKTGEGHGGGEESLGKGEGVGNGDGQEEEDEGNGDGQEEENEGDGDGEEDGEGKEEGEDEGKGSGGEEEDEGKGYGEEETDEGEVETDGGEVEKKEWSIYRVTVDSKNHKIGSVCPCLYADLLSLNDGIEKIVEDFGDLGSEYPTPGIYEYTLKYCYIGEDDMVQISYPQLELSEMPLEKVLETFSFILAYDPTEEDEIEFQETLEKVRNIDPSDFTDEEREDTSIGAGKC